MVEVYGRNLWLTIIRSSLSNTVTWCNEAIGTDSGFSAEMLEPRQPLHYWDQVSSSTVVQHSKRTGGIHASWYCYSRRNCTKTHSRFDYWFRQHHLKQKTSTYEKSANGSIDRRGWYSMKFSFYVALSNLQWGKTQEEFSEVLRKWRRLTSLGLTIDHDTIYLLPQEFPLLFSIMV